MAAVDVYTTTGVLFGVSSVPSSSSADVLTYALQTYLGFNSGQYAEFSTGYYTYGYATDGSFYVNTASYTAYGYGVASVYGSSLNHLEFVNKMNGAVLDVYGTFGWTGLPEVSPSSTVPQITEMIETYQTAPGTYVQDTIQLTASLTALNTYTGSISSVQEITYNMATDSGVGFRFDGTVPIVFNVATNGVVIGQGSLTSFEVLAATSVATNFHITDSLAASGFVFDVHTPLNTIQLNTGNDTYSLTGSRGVPLSTGAGNDFVQIATGGNVIDGGSGFDTAAFSGSITAYSISSNGQTAVVTTPSVTSNTLQNFEAVDFSDMSVNLSIHNSAKLITHGQLTQLEDLYVAFFNRIPEANGLEYWIDQVVAGQTLDSIANSFYAAGVQYSNLTGYSSTMSNADFVNLIYNHCLGRTSGADSTGLQYWTEALAGGTSRGTLVFQILGSAHTFKGDPTWGWVADLLDNKDAVADKFAAQMGLGYENSSDSISHGMAIAAAVTPTDTSAAISLIGVDPSHIVIS